MWMRVQRAQGRRFLSAVLRGAPGWCLRRGGTGSSTERESRSHTPWLLHLSNLHFHTKALGLFRNPQVLSACLHSDPSRRPRQPGKGPLTVFLEEESHVPVRLGFFLPAVNFDQLGNLKTSLVEVVPYPLVFRIIEVTGQRIQVIIDVLKVSFKERKISCAELEKCLMTHPFTWQTNILTLIFYLSLKHD